jgi:PKD repeat protein
MTTTRNVAFRTLGASAIVVLGAACAWEPFGPDATINLANVVAAPAVLIGAGDIAGCDKIGDEQTADLIDSLLVEHPDGTVFTAGDNVYPDGTAQDYADCYEPSWGRFKHRTWATLGNHDYGTGNADASFDYFGARVGPRDLGYYSVDVGGWHLVMLNTGRKRSVPVHAGSVQEQWLRADLAAANHACVMAVFHHPLGSSCSSGYCASDAFWDALYEYAADVVVAGHVHHYERSDPMDPDGNLDPISGIRQFIVGTGGSKGVMKFTLHANSYDWEFVPVPGETLTDSGTGTCVGGAIADFTYTEDPLYTVAFTDASVDPNGTVVAWNWDFGDGGTSTLQNPTHTYAAVSAEYEVTLSVTGDDSTTGITTKTVPVGPRPPVVTITEPPEGTTVIEGDLITFTGTAIDAEEGDLTGSLSWSSDLNGVIGSGGSFSTNTLTVGTHTITASATDSGGLQGSATITVTVKMAGLLTVQVRVAASTDDAEEETSGKMDLTSSDLELVNDGGVDQTVGMRFAGVAIPPGAWISDAYVQFQVDETPSLPTFLTIQGEATDNAATFGSADGDISTRPRTGAAVPWDPPPWPTTGVAGMDQRTPQLAAVIQEIVDRGGWASGNALAIIVTGTGQRVAEAFDGVPAAAPLLFVEFHPD